MTSTELISIREENNLSKKEFALLLGITPMMEGRYESGNLAIPEKVETAAKALIKEAPKKESSPKKEAAPKKAAAKKASSPQVFFESSMGRQITPEEVLKRVPKGVETICIKPEENKAYWVKGDKSGDIALWYTS